MSKSHTRARNYAEHTVLLYYRSMTDDEQIHFLSKIIMEDQAKKQGFS